MGTGGAAYLDASQDPSVRQLPRVQTPLQHFGAEALQSLSASQVARERVAARTAEVRDRMFTRVEKRILTGGLS